MFLGSEGVNKSLVFGVVFLGFYLNTKERKLREGTENVGKREQTQTKANNRKIKELDPLLGTDPPVARHLFRGSLTCDTPGGSRATGATGPFRGGVA